jgi:hypothetical protein
MRHPTRIPQSQGFLETEEPNLLPQSLHSRHCSFSRQISLVLRQVRRGFDRLARQPTRVSDAASRVKNKPQSRQSKSPSSSSSDRFVLPHPTRSPSQRPTEGHFKDELRGLVGTRDVFNFASALRLIQHSLRGVRFCVASATIGTVRGRMFLAWLPTSWPHPALADCVLGFQVGSKQNTRPGCGAGVAAKRLAGSPRLGT